MLAAGANPAYEVPGQRGSVETALHTACKTSRWATYAAAVNACKIIGLLLDAGATLPRNEAGAQRIVRPQALVPLMRRTDSSHSWLASLCQRQCPLSLDVPLVLLLQKVTALVLLPVSAPCRSQLLEKVTTIVGKANDLKLAKMLIAGAGGATVALSTCSDEARVRRSVLLVARSFRFEAAIARLAAAAGGCHGFGLSQPPLISTHPPLPPLPPSFFTLIPPSASILNHHRPLSSTLSSSSAFRSAPRSPSFSSAFRMTQTRTPSARRAAWTWRKRPSHGCV